MNDTAAQPLVKDPYGCDERLLHGARRTYFGTRTRPRSLE
jgi:hypothetical protein